MEIVIQVATRNDVLFIAQKKKTEKARRDGESTGRVRAIDVFPNDVVEREQDLT